MCLTHSKTFNTGCMQCVLCIMYTYSICVFLKYYFNKVEEGKIKRWLKS